MSADCVGQYLEAIARLCIETARNPRLLPIVIEIRKMVPGTIAELAGVQRRIAVSGTSDNVFTP